MTIVQKADKRKNAALGTFTKSREELIKTNIELAKDIESTLEQIERLKEEVFEAQVRMDENDIIVKKLGELLGELA